MTPHPDEQRPLSDDVAPGTFPIVGVGASAGGLEAFTELLSHLSANTGMGFVLVQHLDPEHESALTQILQRATALPVREVVDDDRVMPDHIYVIPPNRRLSISGGILKLEPRDASRTAVRTIDFFFESLASDQQSCAIGVVLSGTANDGTMGLESIKAEGGITFAQDESARYDSMPRSADAAGCVDFVLPPAAIAAELARIAQHPYLRSAPLRAEIDHADATAHQGDASPLPSGGSGTPATGALEARAELAAGRAASEPDENFGKILKLLRAHSGVDFSLYKSATIRRRIARRMILEKYESPASYAAFLRGNVRELDALYTDVLISVTSFFRNPEAFESLKSTVFPPLLQERTEDPFRVWVLGCSTGQEAYSIGMAFLEAAESTHSMRRPQIFATDLNEALLEKARHGLYAKTLAQDLTPERLRRFFVEEQGGYRVIKTLREMVVFARQNFVSDPPFSRMDLISCRNVLIYLDTSLQHRALPTFHYALKPTGFLFLGASESLGPFSNLFEPADKKHKIFRKKLVPTPGYHLPTTRGSGDSAPPPWPKAGADSVLTRDRLELNAQREADRISVDQFAPPAVLVNADLQIIQFRGPTSTWLDTPSGKADLNLLRMAREGLMLPLRATIESARANGKIARREGVRFQKDGHTRLMNMEVIPLKNLGDSCLLVVFEDAGTRLDQAPAAPVDSATDAALVSEPQAVSPSARVTELEEDLADLRDYLHSVQQQNEVTSDDLQAASEELQSANEELQSINEELETSKEELESANEELITVNEELAHRNAELNRVNSDFLNLQTSSRLAVVLVGRDLAFRSFSAQAEKQFDLLAADIGRSIGRLSRQLILPDRALDGEPLPSDLQELVGDVIANVREREMEVRDRDHSWFSLRVRPYFTMDNKVDGAVLVLVNIDTIKRSQHAMQAAREFADSIVETVREPLVVLDGQMRVLRANRSFYRTFKTSPGDTERRAFYELDDGQWDLPELRALLDDILPHDHVINDFEVHREFSRVGERTMRISARRLLQSDEQPPLILIVMTDVSADKRLERELRQHEAELTESDRHKTEFLAMLAHELRNPLVPIRNAASIMRMSKGREDVIEPLSEMIERQIGQVVRLVDDLLDVSRISLGRIALRRERVEVNDVVRQAIETARPSCDNMRHRLEVSLPEDALYMSADAARLTQVVGNLLHNACKFTPPGGRIDVRLAREGDEAVLRVADTGIGIPAPQIERVFDLFVQADASLERSNSGLGIGLALVRNLVEMHGGSVSVESPGAGQGTQFTVRLPLLLDAARARRHGEAPIEISPRRILLVDDNRDSVMSLTMILEMGGHTVRVAYDGEDAIAAAEEFRPEIILLDIGLPKLNGYEAARHIRAQDWGQPMLLIAVTGWGNDEDRRKSSEAGFDGHLVKPVELSVLTRMISDLLPAAD